MEYIKADWLSFDPRHEMGKIFAEGFYQWLKHFSKDKDRLAAAFAHIFDLNVFYLAVINGKIAAITACTASKPPAIQLDKKILIKELGVISGRLAYTMLKKYVVEHSYPFELPAEAGSVEFVATAVEHRGKGAAYGLIGHIMAIMPYKEYILEVVGSNTAAIRLYEKLGFTEFTRTKAPKGSGEEYYLYMKKTVDTEG